LTLEKSRFTGYSKSINWRRQVAEVNEMSDLSERNALQRKDALLFVGDHAAIDFINTVHMVDGVLTDTLHSDDDVRRWMARSELPLAGSSTKWADGELLNAARHLREIAVEGLESRKAKRRFPMGELNAFLSHALSYPQLEAKGSQSRVKRSYLARVPQEFLAPVAEAVADLLANANFDLIRQCAGEKCVLWFYDRTKSHHRRFCSAALCGNRAKVSAYRARQRRRRR
jgi:predicted RNA-binding Zn ribbon-like protein